MQHLSEDMIKQAGLPFLKAYYRMRDRSDSGETHATYDVKTEGGIIADGHLSFKTKIGEPFTATLEATSFDTLDEIKYKIQGKILAWDSFAIGSLITAFVFSYSYAFDKFTIHIIGMLASVVLLLGLLIVMTALLYFLVRRLPRYRYIYAIEQFKKYHADEQWIAIGDDIFDGPENPFLKELKAQCVYNGFGLVTVDHELEVQLLITPSRNEVFGEKRKKLSFVGRDESLQRTKVARFKKLSSRLTSKIPIRGLSFFKTGALGRYQKQYTGQILLSLFSFALLSGIFYRQLQDSPFLYVDEKQYLDSLERYSQQTFPEYDDGSIDTSWVDPNRKEKGYLKLTDEEKISSPSISSKDWDVGLTTSKPLFESDVSVKRSKNKRQIILSTATGDMNTYDCERIYNLHGTYYLVQDNIYNSFEAAEKRIKKMNKKGIALNAFCMGCFDEGNKRYVVHYDFFCSTKTEANAAAKTYKQLLRKKGFKNKKLSIRSLSFK